MLFMSVVLLVRDLTPLDCSLVKSRLICDEEDGIYELEDRMFSTFVNLRMIIDFSAGILKRHEKKQNDSSLNLTVHAKYIHQIRNIQDFQVYLLNFNYMDKGVVELPGLKNISARGNMIEELNSQTFNLTRTNQILEINFSANRISKIDEEAFNGLFNLSILRLQQNMIPTVHENTFKPLVNLTSLDLSYNQLETISKNIFQYNKKLIDVDFKYNKIHAIYQEHTETNLNIIVYNFKGNYYEENQQTKRICNKFQNFNCGTLKHPLETASMKQQFAKHFLIKKGFYVQVQNLMITYLIVIVVCLSFVGFVIYVLGAPREDKVELTPIQNRQLYEEIKEVGDLKVESEEVLYDEIGPGNSAALIGLSK